MSSLTRALRLQYQRLPADVRRYLKRSALDAAALVRGSMSRRRQMSIGTTQADLLPVGLRDATFARVADALHDAGIEFWVVSNPTEPRTVVGVSLRDAQRVAGALGSLANENYWLRSGAGRVRDRPLAQAGDQHFLGTRVLTLYRPTRMGGSQHIVGAEYACLIEFWEQVAIDGADYWEAPRENRAARQISAPDFELTPANRYGRSVLVPRVLMRRMLDDVDFPIDVVYTWVDGSDPVWRERRARAQAAADGVEYHAEAVMESRFEDHDELRYSLRSLDHFAPWVRKVYLVTDGQVPSWLDTSNPRIRIVDHREIFTAGATLPSFNSNAIISNLHHIPGLSEHYVYLNDDVFLGRWLTPAHFFFGSGIARVSPANNRRRFGDPRVEEEPHFNLTRNIRKLLEQDLGVTVSRAVKHTPHPQLRSVHQELEQRYAQAYAETWSHQFRHHGDIVADQLHHYYAQIVGRAVPGGLRYSYVNRMDQTHAVRLSALLASRREVFCINDAPVHGQEPIEEHRLSAFLEEYFPLPSTFELRNA